MTPYDEVAFHIYVCAASTFRHCQNLQVATKRFPSEDGFCGQPPGVHIACVSGAVALRITLVPGLGSPQALTIFMQERTVTSTPMIGRMGIGSEQRQRMEGHVQAPAKSPAATAGTCR